MNNVVPLQPQRPRDYTPAQIELVRRTVAADCNRDEFDLFVEVCKRVGLDPFRKQIYAVVYNKNKPDKRKMSIITGIDGFRAVSARNGDYRPDDEEPLITYKDDLKHPDTNPLGIEKAVVRAFKLSPNGEWHSVPGVAYWDEFAPIDEEWEWDEAAGKRKHSGKQKVSGKWKTMGRIMIAKCAEAQALRKGWPEDLSGVYAPEELAKAEQDDRSASEQAEAFQAEQRLKMVNALQTVPVQWEAGSPIEFVSDGQFADRAIAFIKAASLPQLNAWVSINNNGLKEFWAKHKSDALEVKKIIESRHKELSNGVTE